MERRDFLRSAALAGTALFIDPQRLMARRRPDIGAWRGFNLLNYFTAGYPEPFREEEFQWMAQWGFNFVRLPLSYWNWSRPGKYYEMDEHVLQDIDRAVEWGRRYGIHVCINLHRAPGYCVNPPAEPQNIFEDAEALENRQKDAHWVMLQDKKLLDARIAERDQLDAELQALCELLPLDLREVRSLRVHYESETAAQLTAKIQSIRAFRDITSPMKQTAAGWIPDFGSRYFTADFPFGLKIIRDVGALAGLPMPNINRLWSWYEQTARLPGVACFRLDADSLDSLIRLYA